MRSSTNRRLQILIGLAALTSSAAVTLSETANAYCRTTTCKPEEEADGSCAPNAANCYTKGQPLYWPDLCVTFGVQSDGSVLRNIPYEKVEKVAEKAFQTWISADCGGEEHPFVGVSAKGKVFCDKVEYNHGDPEGNAAGPNANVIMFRDDFWPYTDQDKTIALTTLTYITRTGEILDGDIEINSFGIQLSTGDKHVTSDLQSILTHEVGHFFGLAHSDVEGATMNRNYDRSAITFRDLAADDIDGMCSIYPPQPGLVIDDCTGEEPRYGFSRYCGSADEASGGCSLAAAGGQSEQRQLAVGLGLAALALVRRKRSSGA
ncbi:MAG TPA: matrixin family metalloprotease [Polyangiaceae bacterium]|nr:matrixin family metalloprotease [Polyangiaceae bacterium]